MGAVVGAGTAVCGAACPACVAGPAAPTPAGAAAGAPAGAAAGAWARTGSANVRSKRLRAAAEGSHRGRGTTSEKIAFTPEESWIKKRNSAVPRKSRSCGCFLLNSLTHRAGFNRRQLPAAPPPGHRERWEGSPAAGAVGPPSPPDDKAGKASGCCPDHTVPRPPPLAQHGRHPTKTVAPPPSTTPTSREPHPSSHHGSASGRDTPPPYPSHTARKPPHPAPAPARADTPGQTAAATGARNIPSRSCAAAPPGSPSGTTDTAAAHAGPTPLSALVKPARHRAACVGAWGQSSSAQNKGHRPSVHSGIGWL